MAHNSRTHLDFLKISKSKCHLFASVRGTFPTRTLREVASIHVCVCVCVCVCERERERERERAREREKEREKIHQLH